MADIASKPLKGRGLGIGMVSAIVTVMCGGCGITISILSRANAWDDPGLGLAFWLLLIPVMVILIPSSIAFGAFIGHLSFRLSKNPKWRSNPIPPIVGGILTGIILVIVVYIALPLVLEKIYS
jgi:hypothetical protein